MSVWALGVPVLAALRNQRAAWEGSGVIPWPNCSAIPSFTSSSARPSCARASARAIFVSDGTRVFWPRAHSGKTAQTAIASSARNGKKLRRPGAANHRERNERANTFPDTAGSPVFVGGPTQIRTATQSVVAASIPAAASAAGVFRGEGGELWETIL